MTLIDWFKNLFYSDAHIDTERHEPLDFLLRKHPLHTHKCFDDAVTGLGTELYSGT